MHHLLMQTGATPLYIASQEGWVDIVRLLLNHNADADKALNVSVNSCLSFIAASCCTHPSAIVCCKSGCC